MRSEHLPVHYRPAGTDRWETPADVCAACSDFDLGRLVPVSFCPDAARASAEEHDYLAGGPKPAWMWQQGPDASSAVLV
jgi:hypothetical protein